MSLDPSYDKFLNEVPVEVMATYLHERLHSWFFITHQQRDGFTQADMDIAECMRRVSIWCDEQKEKGTWDAIDEESTVEQGDTK